MAFEKLAAHIDFIEESFKKKKSPRTIAKELGEPGLYQTIARYKAAVWDLRTLVSDAKEIRAQNHDDKRNEAVAEIVNTLDVIALGKLRAKQLLGVNLGDEFDTAEGKHKLTLGSASIYWPVGMRILVDAARLEMEIGGEDPESRKANAIKELADTRLAILQAVDNDPEAKAAIVAALEKRRRNPICPEANNMG